MYTSDIEMRRARRLPFKTAIVYLAVSILCILITNIYAIFGHGIRSDSMDFMFLYPLLGGTIVFLSVKLVLSRLLQKPHGIGISRVGYNLYNSGIASLTSAAMLTGIMEIAGTGSEWIQYIRITGIIFLVSAVIFQITISLNTTNKKLDV